MASTLNKLRVSILHAGAIAECHLEFELPHSWFSAVAHITMGYILVKQRQYQPVISNESHVIKTYALNG